MSSSKKKSMSPEERKLLKVRARRKFKALVRRVIDNLYWLEDEMDDELGDNMFLNVQMLTKKKKKPPSLLTLREKSILNKDKSERTDVERNILDKKLSGLKCFRRYPSFVKGQLAAVTYYRYFAPGRVIVRQDDEGYAMYFILEGEVLVTQSYYDKHLKEVVTVELGTMLPGSGFGEVSLLHGIKRTATITTLTDCEFLEVKREDFDIVLKATVMAEWDDIKRCMSFFDYFCNWDEVAIRECCILGKKELFEREETILAEDYGRKDFVHFIVNGSVDVTECIAMRWFMKGGKKQFVRLNEELTQLAFEVQKGLQESSSSKPDTSNQFERRSRGSFGSIKEKNIFEQKKLRIRSVENLQMRWFKVCILNKLACFNLGECLRNRRIVAREETECLLVPKYWLFHPQQNKANIWDRVQQYMNQQIPSSGQIFRNFTEERKWVAYKRDLFKSIHCQVKRDTNNSIHNVPYSLRIRHLIDYD